MRKFFLFLFAIVSLAFSSCDYEEEDSSNTAVEQLKITSCSFQESSVQLAVGEMKFVRFSITPSCMDGVISASYSVSGSQDVVSLSQMSNGGLCITGLKSGNCVVVARCSLFTSYLTVTVGSGDSSASPYIVTPFVVTEMTSGTRKSFSVNLYNGQEKDNVLFDFQSSDPDVVSAEYSSNSVVLTANKSGKSIITISHPYCEYSAQVLVYCVKEGETPCYITTGQNVVQMALDEGTKNISVSLAGSFENNLSLFTFEVTDGNDIFDLVYNNNVCSVTPKKAGTGLIEVKHPESDITLYIQVVVVKTSVDPYITSDSNFIILNKGEGTVVSCSVVGNDSNDVQNGFSFSVENNNFVKVQQINNSFYLEAVSSGKTKVIVKNKYCKYEHEIYVVVNGTTVAADDCYITTGQNVIRMVKDDETDVSVLLVGGTAGDENSFTWLVEDSSIIGLETGHGSVSESRSLNPETSCTGRALITAKRVGTSIIEVNNPKSSTNARILVKVYEKGTFGGNDYVKVTGEGFIGCVKGETVNYSVELSSDVPTSINWSSEPLSLASITGETENVVIEGKEAGNGIVRCDNKAFIRPFSSVMVCTETREELEAINVLYVDDAYPELYKGVTSFIEIKTKKDVDDSEGYSVSVSDLSVCEGRMSGNVLIVNPLKSGDTEFSIRHGECQNVLKIFVHVVDEVTVDKPFYFEYDKFKGIVVGNTEEISVSFSGTVEKDLNNIKWYTDEGQDVVSITGNGEKCRVKALKKGETYVYASHSKSSNVAKILVYTAETEAELSGRVILTTESTNYLSYIGNDIYIRVDVNDSENNRDKITWSVDDMAVCRIDSNYDDAYIRCIGEGNAVITVRCENAVLRIYVSVKAVKEDIYVKDIVVPSILEYVNGTTHTIEAVVTGFTDSEVSSIVWESSDENVIRVKGNGAVCYMSVIGTGTNFCEITLKQKDAGIERKIQVVTADTEEELKSVYVMSLSKSYYRINRDDVIELKLSFGSNKPDEQMLSKIKWESSDSSVVSLVSNGSSCSAVGVDEGFSIINVSGEGFSNTVTVKIACGSEETLLSRYYMNVSKKMCGIVVGNSDVLNVTLYSGDGSELTGGLSDLTFDVTDSSVIKVDQADNVFNVTALKKGSAYIKVMHPLCEAVTVLVYTADTESELSQYSYPIMSDKTHYLLDVGESAVLMLNTFNSSQAAGIKWTLTDSSVLSYSFDGDKTRVTVKAKKSGSCNVIASHVSSPVDVVFSVSVNEYGTVNKVTLLTESIVHVLKNDSYTTVVQTDLSDEEKEHLVWSSGDETICRVEGNGAQAVLSGVKKGICEITVKYSSLVYRTLVCYVGETEEELNASKCMNIDRRYNLVGIGESITFVPFFARSVANIKDTVCADAYGNGVCTVTNNSGKFTFCGKAEGIGCYRFTNPGTENSFEIFFEVSSRSLEQGNAGTGNTNANEVTGFLTSTKMVYVLDSSNKTEHASLKVTPIGIDEKYYSGIIWKSEDEGICTVIADGVNAKVYANKEGETVVTASSFYSANVLRFRIVCSAGGASTVSSYLKLSSNVINMKEGETESVVCEIMNKESYDVTGFSYSVEDSSVCEINQTGNVFKIKGLRQGQTVLKIGYSDIGEVKAVVSVNGVTGNLIYLTTDNNYTIMPEKSSQTLRVELVGYEEVNGNNFEWEIVGETPDQEGKRVISLSGTGNSRLCTAENSGIAVIRVNHRNGENSARYSLDLTVKVTDYAEMNPVYIKTDSNVVTVEEGGRINVDVQLVNGKESSENLFQWSTTDSAIDLNYSGRQAVISGVTGGRTCRVSVTHPDAVGQILDIIVIVDKKAAADELYISTDSTVIEMKPTDSYRQLNVNLVGGTPSQNTLFSWEILSYSSIERNKDGTSKAVISINGSQDSCIVTAKNEGSAIIRVKNSSTSHYLDIKVIVSLYNDLKFETSSLTLMQAESAAVGVNAPTGKTVIYESSNPDVAAVTGTNKVCMIDAGQIGTSVIRAYTSDGSCEDEIIVKVTKNTNDNPKYITVDHSVVTMNTYDDSKGITVKCKVNNVSDSNLESERVVWKTGSGTNDVIRIVGSDPLSLTGSSCLIVPVNGGTETLYLTWTDSDTNKVYSRTVYVQVEENDAVLVLDPEYVNFSKGEMKNLKCSLVGVQDSELENIRWSSSDTSICRIVDGTQTGSNCTIRAVSNGETTVSCNYNGKVIKYVSVFVRDNYSIAIPKGNQTIALGQESWIQVVVTPDEDSIYESGDIQITSTSSTYLDVSTKLVKRNDGWYIPIKGTLVAGLTTVTCTFHDYSAKVIIKTSDEVVMKLLDCTETMKDGTKEVTLNPNHLYIQCDSQEVKVHYSVYPAGLQLDQKSGSVKICESTNNFVSYSSSEKDSAGNKYLEIDKEAELYKLEMGEDNSGQYFIVKPGICLYGNMRFSNNDNNLEFLFPICISYKDFEPELVLDKLNSKKTSYDAENGILDLACNWDSKDICEKVCFTLGNLKSGLSLNNISDLRQFLLDNNLDFGPVVNSGTRIGVEYVDTITVEYKWPKYCGVTGVYRLNVLVNKNIYR